MSHTNYNKMSDKTNNETVNVAPVQPAQPETPTTVTPENTTAAPVTATETPAQPEPVFGIVCDCIKLNVRKKPDINSEVLFTLPKDAKFKIDLDASTEEWYKVTVNSKEGFCMKKFVTLPQ